MMNLIIFIQHALNLPMHRLLAPLLLVWPLAGSAHDLWLEKEDGGYTLFQGHRHSAHAGAEIVPYQAAAVKSAVCLDQDGQSKRLIPGKSYPVKFSAECTAILVSFSTGYWTKTTWETRNAPKTGLTGVLKSWLSEESVKRVERASPTTDQPIGSGLEITPVGNPFKVAVGGKLVVQITDNKKPMAGVPVAYQGDARGLTGPDGKIAIRLRQAGVQLISASLDVPLDDGKADSAIRTSTLQFELPR
jgi:nickel transport protein